MQTGIRTFNVSWIGAALAASAGAASAGVLPTGALEAGATPAALPTAEASASLGPVRGAAPVAGPAAAALPPAPPSLSAEAEFRQLATFRGADWQPLHVVDLAAKSGLEFDEGLRTVLRLAARGEVRLAQRDPIASDHLVEITPEGRKRVLHVGEVLAEIEDDEAAVSPLE